MLSKIREISGDAGDRIRDLIVEQEGATAIPLPRSVLLALYAAGEHLAKLHIACALADRKEPVDPFEELDDVWRRSWRPGRRRSSRDLTKKTRIPRAYLDNR